MDTILRFEGFTALPLLGSRAEKHALFLEKLRVLMEQGDFVLLNTEDQKTPTDFDLSQDDTVLGIYIKERYLPELAYNVTSPLMLAGCLKKHYNWIQLLEDCVEETKCGSKRRKIFIGMEPDRPV